MSNKNLHYFKSFDKNKVNEYNQKRIKSYLTNQKKWDGIRMQKLVDFINQNLAIVISVFCAIILIIIILLIRAIIITKNKTKEDSGAKKPVKAEISKDLPAEPAKIVEKPAPDIKPNSKPSSDRPVLIEKTTDYTFKTKTSAQDDFYSKKLRESENYDYNQNVVNANNEDIKPSQTTVDTAQAYKEVSAKTNFSLKIVKLTNGEFRFKIEKNEKSVLLSKNFASFEMAQENAEILKNLIKTSDFEVGESSQGYKFYLKHKKEFLVSSVNFTTKDEAKIAAEEIKQQIINGTI